MSEITSQAWEAADRLIDDCQLAPFRRDESARIVQDAMDRKEEEDKAIWASALRWMMRQRILETVEANVAKANELSAQSPEAKPELAEQAQ